MKNPQSNVSPMELISFLNRQFYLSSISNIQRCREVFAKSGYQSFKIDRTILISVIGNISNINLLVMYPHVHDWPINIGCQWLGLVGFLAMVANIHRQLQMTFISIYSLVSFHSSIAFRNGNQVYLNSRKRTPRKG